MLISFCLPIYNEEKILEKNILQLYNFCKLQNFDFDWIIVILINGSTDDSLKISQKINKKYPKNIFFKEYKTAGRGHALKKYWLASNIDISVYMDIDLAVSLENINPLINEITKNNYDLVIGSRLMPESQIKRSAIRELSSQTYNLISRIILNHKISDLQCGFKAINLKKFQQISHLIQDKQWFFDTELIIFAKLFNFKIKEIPVNWSENRYEDRKSKVNIFKDSLFFLKNLIKLKLKILSHLNIYKK